MLLVLGHEPIKSALFFHELSPVVLLICLLGANLWPLWNKRAQNLNIGELRLLEPGESAIVGLADLASFVVESAKPISWVG